MRTQYTVRNLRGGFAPGCDVIIRTHDRKQALTWLNYSVTPRSYARLTRGLATMEKRAASAMQYELFGPGVYLS